MSDTAANPTVDGANLAKPGPHPHESADFSQWKGEDGLGRRTNGLPDGVEPYRPDTVEDAPAEDLV